MCTVALKPVLHENSALCQKVERGIDRGARDPVAPSIHVQIQLVSIKMTIQFTDSIQNVIAFLGVTVLLALQVFCELKLELFDIEFGRHLHKYICA